MTLDESSIMTHKKKQHRKQQWLLEYWISKQPETEMLFFQKLVAEYSGTFLIGSNLNQSDSLKISANEKRLIETSIRGLLPR